MATGRRSVRAPGLGGHGQRAGANPDAVIVELKASRYSGYFGDALMQLPGYLRDRPKLFTEQPAGWLVGLTNGQYESEDPSGAPLHMLVPEELVGWAVQRFAS